MCFTAYIVAYLTHDFGYTLAAAGIALFSGADFAGVAGRILWGLLADRTRAAWQILGWLGVVMTLALDRDLPAIGADCTGNAHWYAGDLPAVRLHRHFVERGADCRNQPPVAARHGAVA